MSERFSSANVARSSRHGGARLGLAIARWIVEIHRGASRIERRVPTGRWMVVVLAAGAR